MRAKIRETVFAFFLFLQISTAKRGAILYKKDEQFDVMNRWAAESFYQSVAVKYFYNLYKKANQ